MFSCKKSDSTPSTNNITSAILGKWYLVEDSSFSVDNGVRSATSSVGYYSKANYYTQQGYSIDYTTNGLRCDSSYAFGNGSADTVRDIFSGSIGTISTYSASYPYTGNSQEQVSVSGNTLTVYYSTPPDTISNNVVEVIKDWRIYTR